jgi:hypothetical protein
MDSRYEFWVICKNNEVVQRFPNGDGAVQSFIKRELSLGDGYSFRPVRFDELEYHEKMEFFESRCHLSDSVASEPYDGRTIITSIRLYPEELKWLVEQAKNNIK